MIGVLCGMSLLSSMAHLPTLALSLLLPGADGGCSLPLHIVITGGTWGLQLALAEHPACYITVNVCLDLGRIRVTDQPSCTSR